MASLSHPSENHSQKHVAILEQAIHTFAELGFHRTDVQVIADRAGVGKGTVYRHFGNKEDLFWATSFEVLGRLERHLFTAIEPGVLADEKEDGGNGMSVEFGSRGAIETLRITGRAYAEFFDTNPDCLEIFVQDRAVFRGGIPQSHADHHEKLVDTFGKIIEEGIARGEIRPVDVRETIIAFGSVLYGTVVFSCYETFGLTISEMAKHAIDIFLRGLRANGAAQCRPTALTTVAQQEQGGQQGEAT